MAQYMLLIKDDLEGYSKYPKTEIASLIEKMMEWKEKLKSAGIHRGAEKLTDQPGKIVRQRQGKLVLDGPFTESKELIGGYFLIEVPEEGAAVEIAMECPAVRYASEIEIRQVADSCREIVALRGQS